MNITQFVDQYYIQPIVRHEGYNVVNTTTYAALALLAVYLIYKWLVRNKIEINRAFVLNTIPFVLFGSTVRVITDSIDTGVMKPTNFFNSLILSSHIYDYGFLTTSPGIYILTAGLFLASLFISHKLKNPNLCGYIGLALWLPHFIVVALMMNYLQFSLPILILAVLPFYFALKYFENYKSEPSKEMLAAIVGAHGLDGAATFFIIDYFGKLTGKSYFEQHVIPSFIGKMFGTFFPFYLLKIAIAFTAAYFIANERNASAQEKYFITLLLIIIGMAPGLRDLLRMAVGA